MTLALVLGGLGALFWAAAGLLTTPSSRALGPSQSVLWLGLAGGVPAGIVLGALDGPLRIRGDEVVALLGGGAFLLVATQVWSQLARGGQVSVAAPIVACDGAVAALAAVLTGHELPAAAYLGLTLMVLGLIVMSASGGGSAERRPEAHRLSKRATIGLAAVAAAGYGGMLYCTGTVSGTSPLWTVTIARGIATLGALGICLLQGRVRPNRRGLPFAAGAGVCDLTAFALYVAGAQHGLAIAAVAASQYGTVATLAAVVLFGERLTARQVAAVGVLVVGAGIVAATS